MKTTSKKPAVKTIKTITRTFAILDKAFRYGSIGGRSTYPKGMEMRIGRGGWYLDENGDAVLPHGICYGSALVVPAKYFHLEVEEETHTITITRRPA